jgi:hypothetical protein
VEGLLGFFMFAPTKQSNSPGQRKVARMARQHKRKARSFPTFCGKSRPTCPIVQRATVGTAQCNSCVCVAGHFPPDTPSG